MPGTNINFPREEKLKIKEKEGWFIAGDLKMSAADEKHKATISWDLQT